MGFRFRKTIRLLPGVRLNLSKSGISTSIGRPGATINIGRRGVTGTAGIPGTGLSYTERLSGAGRARQGAAATPGSGIGCLALLGLGGLLLMIGRCAGTGDESRSASPAQAIEPVSQPTMFVAASALNCRAQASQSAPVVMKLPRDEAVRVVESSGTWSRVTAAAGQDCWVASDYLSRSRGEPSPRPAAIAALPVAAASRPAPVSGEACSCSRGLVCTGPRGGRYCITDSGRKRYGL